MDIRLSATLTGLTLTLVTFGSPVLAGEVTVTGPNGETATVDRTLEKTETGVTGTTTLTGPDGAQATSEFEATRDGDTLSGTRTTTYPDGTTSGNTTSFTGDGEGNYSGTVTRSNRQGETNTYGIEGQRTGGDGTIENNATITGPNGQQSSFNRTRTGGEGSYTVESTFTGPNGQTRSKSGNFNRVEPGSWSGTKTVTNRRGTQRTFGIQRQR